MRITSEQREVIRRSQQSVTWFLTNFGKLKHPLAGILPFKPFSYQQLAIDAFRKYRFNIFKKCRQSGISKITGAFALWYAMFFNHKTVLIVSRRDDDAKLFLRDNIVLLLNNLPPWMQEIWKPIKDNEHELMLPNGSRIQSLTSHPDVLRSQASSLNIIDEAAFIPAMSEMWASGYSTLQHGGSVIVISTCVAPHTMITTSSGLTNIGSLRTTQPLEADGYKYRDWNSDLAIANHKRLNVPTKFYTRAKEPTIIVRTNDGFTLEGTTSHRILLWRDGGLQWVQLQHVKVDDLVPLTIGLGQYNKQPTELTEEQAYVAGVLVMRGSMYNNSICINTSKDGVRGVLNKHLDGKNFQYVGMSSRYLIQDESILEFAKTHNLIAVSKNRAVPEVILRSPRSIQAAFLAALYDSNGYSRSDYRGLSAVTTKSALYLTVRSYQLAYITHMLLVNMGIYCRLHYRRDSCKDYKYIVVISDRTQLLKFQQIIIPYVKHLIDPLTKPHPIRDSLVKWPNVWPLVKQIQVSSGMMVKHFEARHGLKMGTLKSVTTKSDPTVILAQLKEYSDHPAYQQIMEISKFQWNRVAAITHGESETCDFTIPEDECYWSNGFISHNTNGIGNWYWATWTDSEANANQFNPIIVNWWDMDWVIEYMDPLSKRLMRIAPRDHIRPAANKDELERYGPYVSPWLEEQWRGLQEKGEGWKFKQEVLASFVGSGNTVVEESVLIALGQSLEAPEQRVGGVHTYVHPISGEHEDLNYDFGDGEGLWIWEEPITAKPDKIKFGKVIERGSAAHSYVIGVDTATGKGRDYHGLEVIDIDAREQVAEMMMRCLPRDMLKFLDFLGRWYNCALLVVERNNGGDIMIDSLRHDYNYPRIWRRRDINDKPHPGRRRRQRPLKVAPYGFVTTDASKPILNKMLANMLRPDDSGYRVYSSRLVKQLNIYVRKRDRLGRDTNKTEAEDGVNNHDDLVIAFALALMGTTDAFMTDGTSLVPTMSGTSFKSQLGPILPTSEQMVQTMQDFMAKGGAHMLAPMTGEHIELPEVAAQRVLDAYTVQLGAIPLNQGRPIVTPPKYFFRRES